MAKGIHPTHNLFRGLVAGEASALFFCVTCGSYAHARAEALHHVCAGKPKHTTVHRRLAQGMHPATKVPFTMIEQVICDAQVALAGTCGFSLSAADPSGQAHEGHDPGQPASGGHVPPVCWHACGLPHFCDDDDISEPGGFEGFD